MLRAEVFRDVGVEQVLERLHRLSDELQDLASERGEVHRPARGHQVAVDDYLLVLPDPPGSGDLFGHAVMPIRREVSTAYDIRRDERPWAVTDRRHGTVLVHECLGDRYRGGDVAHRVGCAVRETPWDEKE